MTERRYGQWAGDKKGHAEDPARCVAEVFPAHRAGGFISYQCRRKRGHGENGEYCSVHGRSTKDIKPMSRNKGEPR